MTMIATYPAKTSDPIDAVLEAIITKELRGSSVQGPAIAQAPVAALVPALALALASQPQVVPVPQPRSPLVVLLPFLMTTEIAIVSHYPHLLRELIELRLSLAPVLLAALAHQPRQPLAQQVSPATALLPVLLATLAQQKELA